MKQLKESTDIWYCAFLVSKGHKIQEYDVISRGKVKCKFEITDNEWHQLKLEFNNSDIIKFKAIVDQLKDLAW